MDPVTTAECDRGNAADTANFEDGVAEGNGDRDIEGEGVRERE
jgi:hypothetical protein